MKRIALAIVFAGVLSRPVLAEDALFPRCALLCKVWRNVTGHVQHAVAAPSWDDGSMTAPTAEQDARIPPPAELVAVHGEVLHKTRAQRQHEQSVMAAEIKRIEALRNDAPATNGNAHAHQRPKLGEAD